MSGNAEVFSSESLSASESLFILALPASESSFFTATVFFPLDLELVSFFTKLESTTLLSLARTFTSGTCSDQITGFFYGL